MVKQNMTGQNRSKRNSTDQCKYQVKSGIYGLCTADAVGVPAEFRSRSCLEEHPVTDMTGGGSHRQPKGTWSDDSSLALCLADSLAETDGVNPDDIMKRFAEWFEEGKYSPWGECFDCGGTTSQAIYQYKSGLDPLLCGGDTIYSNGNGSLMRILPLVYALYPVYGGDLTCDSHPMTVIHQVSGLTHRHPISQSACGIYVNIAARILDGRERGEAVGDGVECALSWYRAHNEFRDAGEWWKRIRNAEGLKTLPREEIRSSGYVVETLEAALWCLLNTDNYRDCVLAAVNLGEDTDTTAAVAGGLAGLVYGYEAIPSGWLEDLKGKELIDGCCEGLAAYWERRSEDGKRI